MVREYRYQQREGSVIGGNGEWVLHTRDLMIEDAAAAPIVAAEAYTGSCLRTIVTSGAAGGV
jgi:hypothetical protein